MYVITHAGSDRTSSRWLNIRSTVPIQPTNPDSRLRFDSHLRQRTCCFGPIFGDGRLNTGGVIVPQIRVRKVLSMAGIQSTLWGNTTVVYTHRIPMLGEAGEGSAPPSKVDPA